MDNPQFTFSNQMLENKLRSKRDLYEYMRGHLNIWLPQPQYCRLSFLQAILQDKKKCLKASEVKLQNIKSGWNEFAVKNIWQFIEDDQQLQEYLPWEEMQEGRFPDKEFVWGVAFTVKPTWAKQYYDLCLKERNKVNVSPFQKKTIIISDFWQQKLAEHEYISKCKSNKKQSIVIEQEVRPYKKRDTRNKVVVELKSNQVHNNLKESDMFEKSQNIFQKNQDFQVFQNIEKHDKQPSIFVTQGKQQSSSNFTFDFSKKELNKENKDPNYSQINKQGLINMESLKICNDKNEFVTNQQMKTGPSKKRRHEQFREDQMEEDELCSLQNFEFLGEQVETSIKNKSPHKSGKKHKVKEEKKE